MMVFAVVIVAALVQSAALAPEQQAAGTNLPLPTQWQRFSESRRIITDAARSGLIRFALPSDVYGKSMPDLADLRVVDASGAEIPFAVDQRLRSTSVAWTDASLSERGFVRGRYSQAVADLGTGGGLHNALAIETSADEFSHWVEVASSDDDKTWRIVRARAPIYRFLSDGLQGHLAIDFDATRDRWLRIRVLDAGGDFPIDACRVANDLTSTPELKAVEARLKIAGEAPPQEMRFTADFGAPNIPASAVRFATTTPEFYRTAEISVSDDGESWNDAGQGDIYRDPSAGTSLVVQFPEARGRYWRVTIYNRNDRPLQRASASLLATPRYVSIRVTPHGVYRLLYGNPTATAPQYDFETLTSADARNRAPIVSLGSAIATNPASNAGPWTESHPIVLWLALGLAVCVLAWLAVGAMRSKN